MAQKFTKGLVSFIERIRNPLCALRKSGVHIHAASRLASGQAVRYIRSVASKKGAIGIGVPSQSLRQKPQFPHMECGFVVRASFLGGSMGELRLRRFHASGCPVRQPVEPPPLIGVRGGGCLKQPLGGRHG